MPCGSHIWELMREAQVIIWDEAPYSTRYELEAVDRSLKAVTGIGSPFGGKVMLLGGDFRQLLPWKDAKTEELMDDHTRAVNITSSLLWRHFTVLRLTVNKRVPPQESGVCLQVPLVSLLQVSLGSQFHSCTRFVLAADLATFLLDS